MRRADTEVLVVGAPGAERPDRYDVQVRPDRHPQAIALEPTHLSEIPERVSQGMSPVTVAANAAK